MAACIDFGCILRWDGRTAEACNGLHDKTSVWGSVGHTDSAALHEPGMLKHVYVPFRDRLLPASMLTTCGCR